MNTIHTILARIEAALESLRQGRMIILTDSPDREDEGDMIFPAEKITTEAMNFMIQHGSGIVCLSLTAERLKQLDLPLMLAKESNTSSRGTPFTISIEAKTGVTTGVSAHDRAKTILAAVADNAKSDDLARPGHVFPLLAHDDGVLGRAGHTEGAVDLMRLAGLKPAGVLCEVMNRDGTMARGEKLKTFANLHSIKIISIEDIIQYRLHHGTLIEEVATANLPLAGYEGFKILAFKEKFTHKEHVALIKTNQNPEAPTLVRIHSSCLTGDLFGSLRCDCHQQLHYALEKINQEGGVLIYLNQEGRGIGLFNKIKSYALQEQGFDTVEANEALGFAADLRTYDIAVHILKYLNISQVKLLTNNPQKILDLDKNGFFEIMREIVPAFHNEHNQQYLTVKRNKLNNFIDLDFLKLKQVS
jgi:3,4-dihydroxy 2-butanone 4-phosphate synthase / GTP cyclohydrolase II